MSTWRALAEDMWNYFTSKATQELFKNRSFSVELYEKPLLP